MEDTYITHFDICIIRAKYTRTAGRTITFQNPVIGYQLKGVGKILYKGKTYTLDEGDLLYIADGTQYYSVWSGTPDIEFYSVNFRFKSRSDKYEYRFQILKNYPEKAFHDIFRAFRDDDKMEALGLFYLTLSDIYSKMRTESINSKYIAVEPAIRYIEENFKNPIRVDHLARLCSISSPRFFALFKEATGVSPINYKHNILIQHALDMLINTDMSVEEISFALGFSSPDYFRKIFNKITKKNPKDARKTV